MTSCLPGAASSAAFVACVIAHSRGVAIWPGMKPPSVSCRWRSNHADSRALSHVELVAFISIECGPDSARAPSASAKQPDVRTAAASCVVDRILNMTNLLEWKGCEDASACADEDASGAAKIPGNKQGPSRVMHGESEGIE